MGHLAQISCISENWDCLKIFETNSRRTVKRSAESKIEGESTSSLEWDLLQLWDFWFPDSEASDSTAPKAVKQIDMITKKFLEFSETGI